MQAKLIGKERVVQMSAMSLYKQIGSSPNSGANVGDAIDRLGDTGILPHDTEDNKKRFPHTMSHTGFRQQWPSGWKDTAAKFKGLEGFACQSVNEMVTALFRGMPVIVGRAGHSILYLEPVYDGGTLFIDYVNSWGDWGFSAGDFQSGFGFDSMSLVRQSASWAFCFRSLIQRTRRAKG